MNAPQKIQKALAGALSALGIEGIAPVLEHPADLHNGDYSTNVALSAAKKAGKNPRELAQEILAELKVVEGVAKIEIAGPGFINFYLSGEAVAAQLEAARANDMWGAVETLAGRKILIEYTDPNPFKEFHIGHLMSNAIGESISRLVQFSGATVRRANYQGDVGPHVAKALWGKFQNPEMSWGQAYAAGAAAYDMHKGEIDDINKRVYDRADTNVNQLYDTGRAECLAHFEELYKILGTTFDHYFFESETASPGLSIVKAHPDVFEKSDGATVYRGEKVGLHTRVFITSQGLPTYETKELGLAQMKSAAWDFDESITVTAQEQSDYFAVVLAAMKEVMAETAAKIRHISHGMMRLSSGKMSSRTGLVITGESLLRELADVAKERAQESRADDKESLAQHVAVAAIKYQILKQASGKDITFDRERALSLEGDSGPYLQYAHARTHQIVEKAREQKVAAKLDATVDDLARLLHRFPEIVNRAAALREPHVVTNYLIEVASHFNRWYAHEQILDGTPQAAHKVALTDAVRKTLRNGLWILGIPAPEKM